MQSVAVKLFIFQRSAVKVLPTLSRGGIFSQSLVFQAFSDVMGIINEVSTLQRGQFANSGPQPAILLLTHPIEK